MCIIRVIVLFGAVLFLAAVTPAVAAEAPGPGENLQYRVSLGFFSDVARAALALKPLGSGRYQAEFTGATQGAWQVVGKFLPDRYQTEMVWRQGRLQPLVYREEFQKKGERIIREYRFDYGRNCLELWRQAGKREKEKRFEMPLNGPVYDPLSLFYNIRLGAFGPLAGGETLRVQGIPTPEPWEMILRIGPESPEGRKVMITMKNAGGESEPYFIFFTPEWVPHQAWVRVLGLGKIAGRLLDQKAIKKEGLLPPLGAPEKRAELDRPAARP